MVSAMLKEPPSHVYVGVAVGATSPGPWPFVVFDAVAALAVPANIAVIMVTDSAATTSREKRFLARDTVDLPMSQQNC
jgi:hypothetical protein